MDQDLDRRLEKIENTLTQIETDLVDRLDTVNTLLVEISGKLD